MFNAFLVSCRTMLPGNSEDKPLRVNIAIKTQANLQNDAPLVFDGLITSLIPLVDNTLLEKRFKPSNWPLLEGQGEESERMRGRVPGTTKFSGTETMVQNGSVQTALHHCSALLRYFDQTRFGNGVGASNNAWARSTVYLSHLTSAHQN